MSGIIAAPILKFIPTSISAQAEWDPSANIAGTPITLYRPLKKGLEILSPERMSALSTRARNFLMDVGYFTGHIPGSTQLSHAHFVTAVEEAGVEYFLKGASQKPDYNHYLYGLNKYWLKTPSSN